MLGITYAKIIPHTHSLASVTEGDSDRHSSVEKSQQESWLEVLARILALMLVYLGDGVALYGRSGCSFSIRNDLKKDSIENMWIETNDKIVGVIYKPPNFSSLESNF